MYYDSGVEPFRGALDEIFDLLGKCKEKGIKYRIIDTKDAGEPEVYDVYQTACLPSILKKYAIRKVFGTKRNSGIFFAKEVPALLVYDEYQVLPVDTYPHEKGKRDVEIVDFLKNLLVEGTTHPPPQIPACSNSQPHSH